MKPQIAALAALAWMFAAAGPSQAQEADAQSLVGHWTGVINEPWAENVTTYTLAVHIALDREGDPVGVVEYDAFPCAGVWSNGARAGSVWHLDETITTNIDNCAPHVVVELRPLGDAMDVRLLPVGSTEESTGRLVRRP